MARESAEENLCAVFREDFVANVVPRLRADEIVEFAADVTRPGDWYRNLKRWDVNGDPTYGYWALTSDRLVCVYFEPNRQKRIFATGPERPFIVERQSGRWKDYEWRAYLPPTSGLTYDERKSRRATETQRARIVDVGLEDRAWSLARLFRVSTTLIAQGKGPRATFFAERAATTFYDALQLSARENMGASRGATRPGGEIPELLEALARLRDLGVLTAEEFAEKKADLLSRL